MSIPMPLTAIVLSTQATIAGIAAALLRGDKKESYAPHIVAAFTSSTDDRLIISGFQQKISVVIATPAYMFKPDMITVWLALDDASAEDVRRQIKLKGPVPKSFYRGVFPDPVVRCEFTANYLPKNKDLVDEWLTDLGKHMNQWHERLWEIYRDSS